MTTKLTLIVIIVLLLSAFLYVDYGPLREFYRISEYKGENNFNYTLPYHDRTKNTVLPVADDEGTEIFDVMAPFYLFNLTQKANVYIVSQKNIRSPSEKDSMSCSIIPTRK